jgi:hypothetical protein
MLVRFEPDEQRRRSRAFDFKFLSDTNHLGMMRLNQSCNYHVGARRFWVLCRPSNRQPYGAVDSLPDLARARSMLRRLDAARRPRGGGQASPRTVRSAGTPGPLAGCTTQAREFVGPCARVRTATAGSWELSVHGELRLLCISRRRADMASSASRASYGDPLVALPAPRSA